MDRICPSGAAWIGVCCLFALLFAPSPPAMSQPPAYIPELPSLPPPQTQEGPSLFIVPAYTFPSELSLCGEKAPLHVPQVWEALDREFTIAVYNHAQVILWLKRSARYFPTIEKKLKEMGMPDDIKYLAVAESDLMIYAYSPAGAGGPWQFIKPTASRYGLRQGRFFDDRFSFERSTEAALNYLKELHDEFGSWTLAMAAYNCGEARIESEMKQQGEDSYYRLNLPLETERYVLRILAIKVILSNPEKYGYRLGDELRYKPQQVDVIEVNFPGPLHMRTLAKACGSHLKEVKELNPEILGYYFPEGKYEIRLPKGSRYHFQKFYADWAKGVQRTKHSVHVVKNGDTLLKIANKYGVEVDSLKKWNGLKGSTIYPSQKLKIY